MMNAIAALPGVLSGLFLLGGGFFFVAGTVGLLRFPDVVSRLHAVAKADTLGLGLIIIGLALRPSEGTSLPVLLLIWLLVMGSGATVSQLLARYAAPEVKGRHRDNGS